jgi:hypothetical protein
MINKIKRFLNYPLYRKIDCIKDYYYKIISYIFIKNNNLQIYDGNPGSNAINSYNKENNNYIFQNSSYYFCKRMIDFTLNKNIKYNNFIDLGSGKGKICFEVAKNYAFDFIIGVEYDKDLCHAAQNNLNKFKYGKKIQFINKDVLNYTIPDSPSIIYIFNSFNSIILKKFIDNNLISLKLHNCIILYRHDLYANILEEFNAELLEKDIFRKDSIWIFK